ncbi:MAG: sialidase family protein [Candidatus Hydrogenedentales bacterium]
MSKSVFPHARRRFACIAAICVATSAACVAWGGESSLIQVRETTVFDGNKGWEHGGVTYRLACGACIAQMPNGDLLCWWLSGSDNEPSTDNNVLAARSTDKGKTWGEPFILVAAGEEAGALTFMHVTPGGKVIAFGAHWPSNLEYTVWHYFRMESTDNGITWSAQEPVRIRESEDIMLARPVLLKNGEYLLPTSFFEKRPQPLLAPIPALALAMSEAEALALPPDATPGAKPDKFARHVHGCSVVTTSDPELRTLQERGAVRNRPLGLLESTVVQLKDGRLVMLMRAEYGGFLWRTESNDNGRTWKDAWQTDIPNPTSLPVLIRLPDGRIALIHNATGGVVGQRGNRDPLSIWLSNDEMESWYVKEDVITGGQLAYPCPIILDGKLVFSYDRDRRESRFVEVQLPPA